MEIFSSYTGTDFLIFYAFMLATCVFLGLWIPANLRPVGIAGSLEDPEEIAVLAQGELRHAQTVLTELMTKGALANASKGKLHVSNLDVDAGAAAQSVLHKIGAFDMRELRFTTSVHAGWIEDDLTARGLLMNKSERLKLRLLSVLPFVALFVIGLYRLVAGAGLGEAVGYLAILLFITLGCGLWRFAKYNPRTMAGNTLIQQLEAQSSRISRAPTAGEAPFAVAVLGTGVLVGTPWEPVHAMTQSAAGTAGGVHSGGNSDGGSGCGGGGGCGGCGG